MISAIVIIFCQLTLAVCVYLVSKYVRPWLRQALALMIFVAGVALMLQTSQRGDPFVERGVEATAKVIDIYCNRKLGGRGRRDEIEYEFSVSGKVMWGRKAVEDCLQVHAGDPVPVTYLPENPERFTLGHGLVEDEAPKIIWLVLVLLTYPLIAWLCAGEKPSTSRSGA